MSVSFDQIPSTNRVPAAYLEIDASRAVSVQPGAIHRVLMVGLMLTAGSATPNQVIEVTGELGGDPLFGATSQLAQMTRAFKRVNRTARLYALPVSENGAGTAATSTFTLSGTSTKEGTLTVRIGDQRVSIAVANGTAAAAAATALAAAINATPRLNVTAAAATAVVTLTNRHKGEHGNALTIETEKTVAGLTAVDAQPSNGASNPSLATPIAAIDESRYDTIITGLTDAANVALLEAELDRRWGPLVKLPGHLIGAIRGTHSAITTIGAARNSQRSTLFGAGLIPTAPWIVAAQVGARDAQQTDAQPNRPRLGLTLPDVEAPKPADRFDYSERNGQLYDGISTFRVDPSGRVLIERLITTYQTSASGTDDVSYLSIETVRNLAHTYIEFLGLGAKHERDLLGPDDTAVSPGVPLVTPKMLRGEIVALYQSRIRRGLAKDLDGFIADLVVEIDEVDKERANAHVVPRLVGGLVTQAIKLSFQL